MPDLFDWAHARATDPPASHAAAASVKISEQCLLILRSYRFGRAITDHQAYEMAGFSTGRLAHQRCSDLRTAQFIVRIKGMGLSPTGNPAHLSVITAAGFELLAFRGLLA
jgi:hypothetical protein